MIRAVTSSSTRRCSFVIAASCTLGAISLSANAACSIGKIAELKITMDGSRPMLDAKVNGMQGKFTVDSSSFYNIVSGAGASRSGLRLKPPPAWLAAKGPDGKYLLSLGVANDFVVDDLHFKNIEFLAGGNDVAGSDGVVGQPLFQGYDVEYDLANRVIRLMRPESCGNASLAYWVAAKQPYSVVDINPTTPEQPFVSGVAQLDGTQIRVLFDTGANASRISPQAAKQAGLKQNPAELSDPGTSAGIGRPTVKTYAAPFATLKVGDEEILNPHLRVGDTREGTDMLLGADFFLSHRIYVSNTQHKLYFTYNGGQVFSASR
jgi:hypothetical protein